MRMDNVVRCGGFADFQYMDAFTRQLDQMERRNSTQSLSSRASSEQMESGIYITPYAAAMFIAAMITVGVLFITIVATLTVMLQSCQNKNAGVLQLGVRSEEYNYCKMFILHVELNRLEVDEFPSICKAHAFQYFKGGAYQYLRDLNWTIWVINNSCLNSLKLEADGLDVVLLDLDDIHNVLVDKHHANAHILELCTKLQLVGGLRFLLPGTSKSCIMYPWGLSFLLDM